MGWRHCEVAEPQSVNLDILPIAIDIMIAIVVQDTEIASIVLILS
jgi:hypothetical protein